MKDIQTKVMLDLFADPMLLVPAVGGASVLVAGWVIGSPLLMFGGLGGVLAAGGVFTTKFLFKLPELTAKAYDYMQEQKQKDRDKELNELDAKLVRDKNPKSQQSLRSLRRVYAALLQDIEAGKLSPDYDVMETIKQLYEGCIDNLKHSYELYEAACMLPVNRRESLENERQSLIDDVWETVEQFEGHVNQIYITPVHRKRTDLAERRRELERSLEIARRTEERLDALDGKKDYDESEFLEQSLIHNRRHRGKVS